MIKRNPRIIKRNTELWKSIEGFPGYAISNMGRIKSLGRNINCRSYSIRFHKEKILKIGERVGRYPIICLYLKKKLKTKDIHLLVLSHFGPPKPSPKHECNHKDGDKSNNWDTNLEWMTRKQNMQHAYNAGLCNSPKGENHCLSKLTEKEIKQIRKLYKNGKYSYPKLAKKFGVSGITIRQIILFKTWKHLK